MEVFRSLKYPPVVFWEVTDQCNHNCIHCFNYWRTGVESVPSCAMEREDYLRIAHEIITHQPVRIIFTGGEPLLVFEKLLPAIDVFLSNGISLSFNSNASLVCREMADYFREKGITMFLSFPSAVEQEFDQITDMDGAYRQVLAAIDMLYSVGVPFSFNMVVSQVNLQSIFYTAEFLKKRYAIRTLSITRVSEPVNAGKLFDHYMLSPDDLRVYMRACLQIERELNIHVTAASPFTPCSLQSQEEFDLFAFEGGCEAGKISYIVTAQGKVRACARDNKEYGDLLVEPFEVIWERMLEWRDESLIPSECSGCPQRGICRGGCRVDGLPKCGTRNGLDHYSDPSVMPVTFVKYPPYLPASDFTTTFHVPEDVRYCEEAFATRISRKGTYVYCTKKYTDYLKQHQHFNLDGFCSHFHLELNQAKKILHTICVKRILLLES